MGLSSERLCRTLIRIINVYPNLGVCDMVIPGWDTHKRVLLSLAQLPYHIRSLVEPNKRFHAQVNIGAKTASNLRFEDWESE